MPLVLSGWDIITTTTHENGGIVSNNNAPEKAATASNAKSSEKGNVVSNKAPDEDEIFSDLNKDTEDEYQKGFGRASAIGFLNFLYISFQSFYDIPPIITVNLLPSFSQKPYVYMISSSSSLSNT